MKLPNSTYKLLYKKIEGDSLGEEAVLWAIEMLEFDFDSEHLRILAGVTEPYSDFYLLSLIENVFKELELIFPTKKIIIKDYIYFLITSSIKGKYDVIETLSIIYGIYINSDHDEILEKFAYLHWAKDDLNYNTEQNYWVGATKENIHQIIINYFQKWEKENQPDFLNYTKMYN